MVGGGTDGRIIQQFSFRFIFSRFNLLKVLTLGTVDNDRQSPSAVLRSLTSTLSTESPHSLNMEQTDKAKDTEEAAAPRQGKQSQESGTIELHCIATIRISSRAMHLKFMENARLT